MVCQLHISGKKFSVNIETADNFMKQFLVIIKEKCYNTENIYNADVKKKLM